MQDKNKYIHFDSEMKEYFDSLPPLIQETILQSGAVIKNKEDLVSIAKDLIKFDVENQRGV